MLENIGRNVNRYRPLWHPRTQPAAKPRYVLGAAGLELVPQPFTSLAELVAAVRSETVPRALLADEHWADPHVVPWLEWSTLACAWAARRAYAERDVEHLWRDVEGMPFRTTVALLEAFRGPAASAGARLIVVLFPMRESIEALLEGGEPFWSTLFTALDARGIEWLDASAALLAEARTRGAAALYAQSHFSPLGNELVARALAERLGPAGPR